MMQFACTIPAGLAFSIEDALAFTSENTKRFGLKFLRPEKRKLKGMPAAIVKWSASVWLLTTEILKLGLGSGRRQHGGEGKSVGLYDLERSLPDLGHSPVVWMAEASY